MWECPQNLAPGTDIASVMLMSQLSQSNRYLKQRGRVWWYRRRVPEVYRLLDTRDVIETSLRTASLETARLRRDLVETENRTYWESLVASTLANEGDTEATKLAVTKRYESAVTHALMAGFQYVPAERLAQDAPLTEIVERLIAVDERRTDTGLRPRATEALLGGATEPIIRVSDALEILFDEIAVSDLLYKSEQQRRSWKKVKRTSVEYFIEVIGDLPMRDIERNAHAVKFQNWWIARMNPKEGSNELPVSANTVNRHIGNLRSLYSRYFKHVGEEDRPNPFRNMYFKQKTQQTKPPFSSAWIRDQILRPGALSGWRADIQLIAYLLVETGCRPSEIINLQPEHIHVETDVPYIEIRGCSHGKARREVKTDMSERDIPLVGVSLEAARRAPRGFPHYFDRNELVSANLMKAFRTKGLLETPAHKIYSLRHSFEKRMQEANIDYQLRCALMGHKNTRPKYGDGGELSYRRNELLKIVLPYTDSLFEAFDVEHGEWWNLTD